MANSIPIVIASDQTKVPSTTFDGVGNSVTSTTQNGKTGMSSSISGQDALNVTGSGSALNNTPIADTNVSNYHCASIQHTVTGTNTITFEESNDDATFTVVLCSNAATANAGPVTTAAATGMFYCPIH